MTMRTNLIILFCGISCLALAQSIEPTMPRGRGGTDRTRLIEKNGGLVWRLPTGPVLMFLNAQHEVPAQQIEAIAKEMNHFLRIPNEVRITDANGTNGAELAERVLREGTNRVAFVVVLVSETGAPSLLVAPENRWAVVNVQALATDKPNVEIFRKRVQREQWRAVCYVLGAANSSMSNCAMSPVFTPSDLDSLALTASPEPFARMRGTIDRMGMQSPTATTYRHAVEQGWAPSPTNDIQRAIWQEIRKIQPLK